jgi:phosphoribosylformimino-5-aminoimidazole carboxamide ribotide isomerase
MMLIPSIDLRGGQCVRLLRGDFDAETRYATRPADLLLRFAELGARWLHVVDLDGARDGALANAALVAELARAGANVAAHPGGSGGAGAGARPVRLQVGGGVRSAAVARQLFDLGVARVVVGSAAVEEPDEVARWLEEFGPQRLCLAFDVRVAADGVPRVQTRGWRTGTQLSLWDALERFAGHGLVHVLCTDVERDGALEGPSIGLYREAMRRRPDLAWQASGGVRDAADLTALDALGMAAAISGKAMIEQRIGARELAPFLAATAQASGASG